MDEIGHFVLISINSEVKMLFSVFITHLHIFLCEFLFMSFGHFPNGLLYFQNIE